MIIQSLYILLSSIQISVAALPELNEEFGDIVPQDWHVCDTKVVDAVQNEIVHQLCLRALDASCLTESFKGRYSVPVDVVSKDGRLGNGGPDTIGSLVNPKRLIPEKKRKEIFNNWRATPGSGESTTKSCAVSKAWPTNDLVTTSVDVKKIFWDIAKGAVSKIPGAGEVLVVLDAVNVDVKSQEKMVAKGDCPEGDYIHVKSTGDSNQLCKSEYKISPKILEFLRQPPDIQLKVLKNKHMCGYYNNLLAVLKSGNDMTERMLFTPATSGPTCMGKGKTSFQVGIKDGMGDEQGSIDVTSSMATQPPTITMTTSGDLYSGADEAKSNSSEYKISYVDEGKGVLCESTKLTSNLPQNYRQISLRQMSEAHSASVLISAASTACCAVSNPPEACMNKYLQMSAAKKAPGEEVKATVTK